MLPAFLLARTLWTVGWKRRFGDELLASLPLIGLLVCAHAAGELLGYLAGPGDSPGRLA